MKTTILNGGFTFQTLPARVRAWKVASVAIVAGILALTGNASAQDTVITINNGATDLTTAASYSIVTNTAGAITVAPGITPTAGTDILFFNNGLVPGGATLDLYSVPYLSPTPYPFVPTVNPGSLILTVNSNLTTDSINDANRALAGDSIIITNTSATNDTLTIPGGPNNTNATPVATATTPVGTGDAAGDLIYTATGANLAFANTAGAGTLNLALTNTGNIDSNGTLSIADGVTITAGKTITFTGTGATTISGNIAATSGALIINDAGGSVTLSGANGFSGGVGLAAGTLNINSATALGTALFFTLGGTIDNTSGGAITNANNNSIAIEGNLSFTGTNDLNLGTGAVTLLTPVTITVNAGTLSLGGAIGATANGLTKAGAGTLVLSGVDLYTGTTTVTGGTLQVGNGTSGSIAPTSGLTLGGGTFNLTGLTTGVTPVQTLASLTTSAGTGSVITLNPNGGTSTTLTFTTAAPVVGVGSSLNFNIAAGNANAGAAVPPTNTLIKGLANNVNGIINGAYTVTDQGGTYFATVNGSGNVAGLTGQAAFPTSLAAITGNFAISFALGGNTNGAGGLTEQLVGPDGFNSLSVNTTDATPPLGGANLDLHGNSLFVAMGVNNGGLLFTGANSYTIQTTVAGGFIESGTAGGAITFNNYLAPGATLTIGGFPASAFQAIIQDTSGATPVTFAGPGTTILTGANTYTGGTFVNGGGTLIIGNGTTGSISNTGALKIAPGATVEFDEVTGSTYSPTTQVTDNGTIVGGVTTVGQTNGINTAGIGGTGGFTQSGAGTWIFGSTNDTYSGLTLITAGAILAQGFNNVFSPNSLVQIAAGGTLDLSNTNETIPGLTGTGGTVTDSSATASALTITPIATSPAVEAFSGNIVQPNGVISLTINSGTGGVTEVLTGNSTYTGGTTIAGGMLAVGGTKVAGVLTTPLGTGGLTNASGLLETTASITAGTAPQTINVGTAIVSSAYTQSAGSTGSPTILLLQVVGNQGVLPQTQAAAGLNGSYDTLAASGSAAFTASPNDRILLNFQGAAPALAGQRFQVVSVPGALNTALVTSSSATTPTAVTATGNLNPYIIPITSYNDSFNGAFANNNIIVTLFQPLNTFAFPGLTPNQTAVANNLDNIANNLFNPASPFAVTTANGVILTPLSGVNKDFFDNILEGVELAGGAGNVGHALDELSPQRYEVLRNVAFDNYAFDIQGLDQEFARERMGVGGVDTAGFTFNNSQLGPELSQARSRLLAWSPAPEPGLLSDSSQSVLGGVAMVDKKDMKQMAPETPENLWNVFIDGGVDLGDKDSNEDLSHSSYTTGRVRLGADYRVCTDLRVGALFGYGHTDADLDNEGSKAHVDSYTPGVFLSYADKDGFYANGLFTYTDNEYSTHRDIVIPGVNRTADGSFSGNQFGGDLDGGYDFHRGDWTFGPSAGLTYVNLGLDSFTESGAGAADLGVSSQSADSLRSRLGGTASYRTEIGSVVLTPHVSAYWQHEFLDDSDSITSSFVGLPGGSFAVQTTKGDSDNALVGAGLNAELNQTVTLFIDYGAEAGGSTFFGQSATGGVKIGF